MSNKNSIIQVDPEASIAHNKAVEVSSSPGDSFFGIGNFNFMGVKKVFEGAVQVVQEVGQGVGQGAGQAVQAVQEAGQVAQGTVKTAVEAIQRAEALLQQEQKQKPLTRTISLSPSRTDSVPSTESVSSRTGSGSSTGSDSTSPSRTDSVPSTTSSSSSRAGSSPSTKSFSSTASVVDVLKRLIRGNKDKNQSAPLQKPPIDNSDVEKNKKKSASCFSFLSNGAYNLFEYFSKSKDVNKTKTTPVEKKATQHERRESKQEKPSPVKKVADIFSSIGSQISGMWVREIPYDNLEVGVKNGKVLAKLTEGGTYTLSGAGNATAGSLRTGFGYLYGAAKAGASVTAGSATTFGSGAGEVGGIMAGGVIWAASSSPEGRYGLPDIKEWVSSSNNTGASGSSGYGPGDALTDLGGYFASTRPSQFVPGERAAQASKCVAQALVNGGVGVVKVGNRVGAAGTWASIAAEKARNLSINVAVPGNWRGR